MSGFRSGRSFSNEAKPVEVGKEYGVVVTELSSRGDVFRAGFDAVPKDRIQLKRL